MKALIYCLIFALLLISSAMAEEAPAGIQAVTASGDAVGCIRMDAGHIDS